MPELEALLRGRRALYVGPPSPGSSLMAAACAWILEAAGLEPGFSIRGTPANFESATRPASTRRKIVGGVAAPSPFVVDGDFVYLENGSGSNEDIIIVTGDAALSEEQARAIAERVPEGGTIFCDARRHDTCSVIERHARCATATYALDVDATGDVTPIWLGATVQTDAESTVQPFDLFVGGSSCGRFALRDPGADIVRIAVGAIAACAQGFGVDVEKSRAALTTFVGLR